MLCEQCTMLVRKREKCDPQIDNKIKYNKNKPSEIREKDRKKGHLVCLSLKSQSLPCCMSPPLRLLVVYPYLRIISNINTSIVKLISCAASSQGQGNTQCVCCGEL